MTTVPDHPNEMTGPDSADWSTAIGRAAMYSLLSRSLLFPTADGQETVRLELMPLLGSFSCRSDRCDALLAEAIEAHDTELDELRRAHGRIFTHIENQDCPVHEAAYSPGDVFRRADVMADVAAFYRAHGLQVGGTQRERVDHIATELEFMSFLARKEAYAIDRLGPDERGECRHSQEAFLRDHLSCWAPGLASRIHLLADHPFLCTIGLLLAAWIETDQEWLGVEPAADHNEPQPMPEPDDGLCGATSSATPVQLGSAPT
jgi:TorA maturation chaperone TorD